MRLTILLNLLHVVTAFVLITGILGRGLTMREAGRASDVHVVEALVRLAGRFEIMVRAPSIAVLAFGLLSAWRTGWPILGFLQGGTVNWILASLVLYLSMIPLIIWLFLPRGRIFEQALEDAVGEGRVTPALRRAFADPVVAAAHVWELIVLGVIIVLMVAKPF